MSWVQRLSKEQIESDLRRIAASSRTDSYIESVKAELEKELGLKAQVNT